MWWVVWLLSQAVGLGKGSSRLARRKLEQTAPDATRHMHADLYVDLDKVELLKLAKNRQDLPKSTGWAPVSGCRKGNCARTFAGSSAALNKVRPGSMDLKPSAV